MISMKKTMNIFCLLTNGVWCGIIIKIIKETDIGVQFIYLDKKQVTQTAPVLFEILYANMNKIAPTGNTKTVDREFWIKNWLLSMEKEYRQVVCMYFGGVLAGYFQYSLQADTLFLEDIQIEKKFQGKGLFSALFRWLIGQLHSSICFVRANSDKRNTKLQGILQL